MANPLSGLFGQSQPGQPGMGSRITGLLGDSSNAMMALGGQMLAHRQNANQPMFDPRMMMLAQATDQERVTKRKDEQKELAKDNATRTYAIDKLGWDLGEVDALAASGQLGTAVTDELKRLRDPEPAGEWMEVDGRLAWAPNSGGAPQFHGEATAAKAPSSYEEFRLAQADPAYAQHLQQSKARNGGMPSATIAKEIFESDEGMLAGQNVVTALDRALELNEKAYSGPLAAQRGYAGSLLGAGNDAAVATEDLKNIVTAQALESLKATFGSMPTEGERKILLEIQGSVNQAPKVREGIYKRAKEMAQRRIQFNQQKARSLRDQTYFAPNGMSPGGGDTAPEGVDPADWEYMTPEERVLFQQ